MSAKPVPGLGRFLAEVRELAVTARKTWRMLSRSHRCALLGAVAIMAIGGATATALPLLSGRLVDRVATGIQSGESQAEVLAAVETLLGVTKRGNLLTFDPRVPMAWDVFEVEYRHGSALYRCRVERARGDDVGVWLDGKKLPGTGILLRDDGWDHDVRVVVVGATGR